jgi:predicted DNA-binding transcriptional regulator AlpA
MTSVTLPALIAEARQPIAAAHEGQMKKLTDINAAVEVSGAGASDDLILSRVQTARLINLSTDTLDRLVARGEGPPRVRISPRRVGHPLGSTRKWLAQRARG